MDPNIPKPVPTKRSPLKYLLLSLGFMVCLILVFIIGSSQILPFGPHPVVKDYRSTHGGEIFIRTSPLLANQSANFKGRITRMDGSLATVVNDNGLTDQFPVSQTVSFFNKLPNSSQASVSAGLKYIELNKECTYVLDVIAQTYTITNVSCL